MSIQELSFFISGSDQTNTSIESEKSILDVIAKKIKSLLENFKSIKETTKETQEPDYLERLKSQHNLEYNLGLNPGVPSKPGNFTSKSKPTNKSTEYFLPNPEATPSAPIQHGKPNSRNSNVQNTVENRVKISTPDNSQSTISEQKTKMQEVENLLRSFEKIHYYSCRSGNGNKEDARKKMAEIESKISELRKLELSTDQTELLNKATSWIEKAKIDIEL